jgi:hypothetical protein
MAKTKKSKSALPYLRRLADDEYVHDQIRNAFNGMAAASRRISHKRGKAAEDKEVYANLRQAATSVRNVSRALRRRKPEPMGRGRKLVLVAAVAGGVVVVVTQRDRLMGAFSGGEGAGEQAPGADTSPEPQPTPAPAPDQTTAA